MFINNHIHHGRRTARAIACAAALGLALSACGSETEVAGPEEYTNEAPTTLVTPASVPVPAPAPSTEPEPVTTEAPAIEVASTPEFCSASAAYYTASEAGDFVSLRNPRAIQALFTEMEIRLVTAIGQAPNDELAAPALAAQVYVGRFHDGLASFDYDGVAFEASQTYIDLGPDLDGLASINGQLEGYLESECDLSLRQLRVDGQLLAEQIIELAGDVDQAPTSYREVVDVAERIKVSVPSYWSEVSGSPVGATAELVVTPNTALFETSWAVDGIRILSAPTATSVDVPTAMAQTPAATECDLVSSNTYDDGTYVGWINHYRSCGGSSVASVIGATSYDGEFTVLVEVQFDQHDVDEDEATLQQIIDTFVVR